MRSVIAPYGFMTGKRYSSLLAFFVAICYGLSLSLLPVDAFVDRDNYLVYASASAQIISRYVEQGVWSVLFNEPVWLGVNIFLGSFFSPENTLRIIIFVSSFITAFLVLKYNPRCFIFLMVILFLPQVLKNNIIHLRQGLGIAVFLCGWFSHRSALRYILYAFACLIHSSFFVIVFLMVLNNFLIWSHLASEIRAFIVFLSGLFVGFLGLWVAGMLGARQASEYAGDAASVSGLGFIFWMIVAGLFTLQGKTFLRENSLQLSIVIFYLSTYFFLPVTARIFESGILLVFFSLLGLTSYRKYVFISALSFYFLIQWGPRFTLPGFGWGIENYI